MRQRFGDSEPDRALPCLFAVEAVGYGLNEYDATPMRESHRVGVVRKQQDASLGIAHGIGEQFVVLADFGQALGHPFFFTPKNVCDCQRQDSLRRFLEGLVKDFLDGIARQDRRH